MFNEFNSEDRAQLHARLESSDMPESIYDLLVQTAKTHGDDPAWQFIDTDVKRTWREVLEGVDTAAAAFAAMGIKMGTHVAVMAWN